MSVKAQSLVWDYPCPSTIGEKEFKPNHKYVLVAYADHADHAGRNIYPAVETVASKTGYDERTIQRLTRDLQEMGLLVNDGFGPRGQNRWKLPVREGGDKLSPLTNCQGDIPSGDIPSGDKPSGDKLSPELRKEPSIDLSINTKSVMDWATIKTKLQAEMPRASFETWVQPSEGYSYDGETLVVAARNQYAQDWLQSRVTERAQQIGNVFIRFVVMDMDDA